MNNPSSSVSSSAASASPKVIQTNNKGLGELVTINEKVSLTKKQHEVLKIICNSYEMTVSEYMQQALVEAMRFDIEEGDFSEVLLEKLDEGNKKRNDTFTQSGSIKSELDVFKKP